MENCEIIQLTENIIVNICNYRIYLEQNFPGDNSCTNLDEAINDENKEIYISTANTFCFVSEGTEEYIISFSSNKNGLYDVYIDSSIIFNLNNLRKKFKKLTITNKFIGNSFTITNSKYR